MAQRTKKQQIMLYIASVLTLFLTFWLGLFIGCKFCCSDKVKKNYLNREIKFYTVKKHLGKQMEEKEKNAMMIFKTNSERCLQEKLEGNEKEKLEAIKSEVLNLAKDNTSIRFKLSDLRSGKDADTLAKKVRRCFMETRKHMTKTDRRLLHSAITKMKIDDIIGMFYGIK
ncbi:MAG: hypothetical protein IJT14_03270 [Rickettsiales bacterium]|nr:hypothetical protein [Rickettsiales bacterium]